MNEVTITELFDGTFMVEMDGKPAALGAFRLRELRALAREIIDFLDEYEG